MLQFEYDVKACGRLSNRVSAAPIFFLLQMYSMHLTSNYIAKMTVAMTGSFNWLFRSDVKWTCTSPFTLAADVPLHFASVPPSNWPPPISGAVPVPSFASSRVFRLPPVIKGCHLGRLHSIGPLAPLLTELFLFKFWPHFTHCTFGQ